MTGIVTSVLRNRGIAFVRGDDGLSRLALAREFRPAISFDKLLEGQRVEFIPVEGGPRARGNGLRAEKVVVLSD